MAASRCGYDYFSIWSPRGPHHRRGKLPHRHRHCLCQGTPILAAADGTVTVANGLDSWGGSYATTSKSTTAAGWKTLYAHCSSICVTTGQQVQAGEVIGYVGHTGRATGNHLHLEVRIDGNRADVLRYFTL